MCIGTKNIVLVLLAFFLEHDKMCNIKTTYRKAKGLE